MRKRGCPPACRLFARAAGPSVRWSAGARHLSPHAAAQQQQQQRQLDSRKSPSPLAAVRRCGGGSSSSRTPSDSGLWQRVWWEGREPAQGGE